MPSWTPHGPISLTGAAATAEEAPRGEAVALQVLARATAGPSAAETSGRALLSPAAAARLGIGSGQRCWVALAAGSDCVMNAAVDPSLPGLSIALLFEPPVGEPFELVHVEAEVSVLGRPCPDEASGSGGGNDAARSAEGGDASGGGAVALPAGELAQQFLREHLGAVVAANEACVLRRGGLRVVLRVAAADTLEPEEAEERIGYHCYRGLVTPDTRVYLTSAAAAGAASAALEDLSLGSGGGGGAGGGGSAPQSLLARRPRVVLLGAQQRPPPDESPNFVRVLTNDGDGEGEEFPVLRKQLRPCIALTAAVRSAEARPTVSVDVDTCTMDRVLLFLEALALGREPPSFGIHLVSGLLAAAEKLGLRPLEEYCKERLGAAESRLRWYSLDEIKRLNAAGGCWLIIDGMILDGK
eukprot:scaffold1.g5263.t1